MKIVIIEDELITAEDLKDYILHVAPYVTVTAILQSVSEAKKYFQSQPLPNLIFSDIQLGDGQSFEIFSSLNLKVPVIFCTAFDEYAIEAFNANGIHYILKPFNEFKIKEAIQKYTQLQNSFSPNTNSWMEMMNILQNVQQPSPKTSAILVYYQNKVIPIQLKDIAVFYIKNDATFLYTFNEKTYIVNKTLDELQQLNAQLFYRANRQFIINKNAVKEATHLLSRKISVELNVPFDDSITISKEKISNFFEWLTGESL